MKQYVIGIDQSTQGTKALLVDDRGALCKRCDLPHRQIINDQGWVEHDPMEILRNVSQVVHTLVQESGVGAEEIAAIGLSNQRETGMVWNRRTGEPVYNAIVWQCARGKDICLRLEKQGMGGTIKERTGLNLSPYFTAAKLAWVLENVPGAKALNDAGDLCFGTMDSWLIFRLSGGKVYRTDYSNASRTQLFNLRTLSWDEEICNAFGIRPETLPEVTGSDALYCTTDVLGALEKPVPLHAVLGDSHGALYGQGCHQVGMVKSTYGTGSSVMMNIGGTPAFSDQIVTSLAWGIGGQVDYVLEGNINYSAAVITWLKDDLKLISSARECSDLAMAANPQDTTYLVPAFSGLGAPYWDSDAKASLVGMTRCTGKNELVRAAEECIALQIHDILKAMEQDSGIGITQLRVDGGPTRDAYLMQFQSDIVGCEVAVPPMEELSGLGAAYLAGIAQGAFDRDRIFSGIERTVYAPRMTPEEREKKLRGWNNALESVLHRGRE